MNKQLRVAAFMLLAAIGTLSLAEVPNRCPEQLREKATHVVTGDVVAIYVRASVDGSWDYTNYLTEVRVTAVEKGDGLVMSEPLYVRYFTRHWNNGDPPPSSYGHRGLPNECDHVRVFLARNASDGFNDGQTQGVFHVMYPNGFEIVTKAKTP